jgi:hypothetical protein
MVLAKDRAFRRLLDGRMGHVVPDLLVPDRVVPWTSHPSNYSVVVVS